MGGKRTLPPAQRIANLGEDSCYSILFTQPKSCTTVQTCLIHASQIKTPSLKSPLSVTLNSLSLQSSLRNTGDSLDPDISEQLKNDQQERKNIKIGAKWYHANWDANAHRLTYGNVKEMEAQFRVACRLAYRKSKNIRMGKNIIKRINGLAQHKLQEQHTGIDGEGQHRLTKQRSINCTDCKNQHIGMDTIKRIIRLARMAKTARISTPAWEEHNKRINKQHKLQDVQKYKSKSNNS